MSDQSADYNGFTLFPKPKPAQEAGLTVDEETSSMSGMLTMYHLRDFSRAQLNKIMHTSRYKEQHQQLKQDESFNRVDEELFSEALGVSGEGRRNSKLRRALTLYQAYNQKMAIM
jgi:hypothetical protein